MVFTAPGQATEYTDNSDGDANLKGWSLLFHPDLIRKSDLADLAEILAKGPENIIGDAINEAINTDPADPECAVVKQVANLEKLDQVKKFMNKAQDGMFKRLESAFLDDIILWRWPIDPRGWLDSPGILSTILGDKEGYTLNFHYIARNNIFFKIMSVGKIVT